MTGLFYFLKGSKTAEQIKDHSKLYLCAKKESKRLQKHYRTQIGLNIALVNLRYGFIAKALPPAEVLRQAALKTIMVLQEVNLKKYQTEVLKTPYCSKFTKAGILKNYPFKTSLGLIYKRNFGAIRLKSKTWTLNIYPQGLRGKYYLEGQWQVKGTLNTWSQFSYQKKEKAWYFSSLEQVSASL